MKNITPTKNTCYDWLINYVLEPMRKGLGGFKDKTATFLRQAHLKRKETKQTKNTKHQKFFYTKKEKRETKD